MSEGPPIQYNPEDHEAQEINVNDLKPPSPPPEETQISNPTLGPESFQKVLVDQDTSFGSDPEATTMQPATDETQINSPTISVPTENTEQSTDWRNNPMMQTLGKPPKPPENK